MKYILYAIESYLKSNGWISRKCPFCHEKYLLNKFTYFFRCSGCDLKLKNTSIKSKMVTWEQLWYQTSNMFKNRDKDFSFITSYPIALNGEGGTKFMSSGLQVLEPSIFHGVPFQKKPIVVAQPVIRMNYQPKVTLPGYSTSFVNICSEQILAKPYTHIKHLKFWLSYLIEIVGTNAVFEIKFKRERWNKGGFSGVQIQVYVDRIEVGDAIYITQARKEASHLLPIVDWSLGFERILSAANKTESYTNFVFPFGQLATPDTIKSLDDVRTSTLMILGGVKPSARSHGRVLRKIIRSLAGSNITNAEIQESVSYFINYWLTFLQDATKLRSENIFDCVFDIINSEMQRNTKKSTS